MKIIIGAFDKVDIKLLSYENLFHHMDYRILQIALKVKSAQKIAKNFFQKISERAKVLELFPIICDFKFYSARKS